MNMEEIGSLLNIRSEDVNEIMGQMPPWILRRGMYLIAFIFLMIVTGAYYLKYPDIVRSKVVISSSNPPVKLVARTSAPIERIFVGNNHEVKAGQEICILSNPARYKDVNLIAKLVNKIDISIDLSDISDQLEIQSGLQLGELQSEYTDLYQAIQRYRFFLMHNNYNEKIRQLQSQASYQGQLARELEKRDVMLQEQLKLQHDLYKIDSSLVKERVISKVEYEESQKKLLDQKINTQSNYSNILQSMVQQQEYKKNINDTQGQLQSENNDLQQKIRDATKRFQGGYAAWKQEYSLVTPISGKIVYIKYWSENQFVQAGEGVFMIVSDMQDYKVRATVGLNGAGKIKVGQQVLIKLTAYPSDEYGLLKGHVFSRSDVSMDSVFALEITLDKGLITNLKRVIPPQSQLDGVGEILTEDKSIVQRLTDNMLGGLRQ